MHIAHITITERNGTDSNEEKKTLDDALTELAVVINEHKTHGIEDEKSGADRKAVKEREN